MIEKIKEKKWIVLVEIFAWSSPIFAKLKQYYEREWEMKNLLLTIFIIKFWNDPGYHHYFKPSAYSLVAYIKWTYSEYSGNS